MKTYESNLTINVVVFVGADGRLLTLDHDTGGPGSYTIQGWTEDPAKAYKVADWRPNEPLRETEYYLESSPRGKMWAAQCQVARAELTTHSKLQIT